MLMYRRFSLVTYANALVHNNYNNTDTMNHFIKYLGIGGISTLIQFLILTLLVEFKLAPEVIASAGSYLLSSVFNYYANYYYTFASSTSHTRTLPKFIVAVGLGLAINTLLFALFLHLLNNQIFDISLFNKYTLSDYYYLAAQFLATCITVFVNFLVHKLWIYKGH